MALSVDNCISKSDSTILIRIWTDYCVLPYILWQQFWQLFLSFYCLCTQGNNCHCNNESSNPLPTIAILVEIWLKLKEHMLFMENIISYEFLWKDSQISKSSDLLMGFTNQRCILMRARFLQLYVKYRIALTTPACIFVF